MVIWPSRRDHCGESDPPRGGLSGGPKGGPLNLLRWRISTKNRGVALTTSSPSRAAPRRGVRGGDTRCRRRTGLYPGRLGKSVPTLVQCGFRGTTWTTTARAPPSEKKAPWLLTKWTTWVDPPPSISGPPLRRHVLDPRRRKSSIIARPLEAGFSGSRWTIFSMTTSRPPLRSTVSCPVNPRALLGAGCDFQPWHGRAPRNASCTDFPLRDRRSRRLWGNRNSWRNPLQREAHTCPLLQFFKIGHTLVSGNFTRSGAVRMRLSVRCQVAYPQLSNDPVPALPWRSRISLGCHVASSSA